MNLKPLITIDFEKYSKFLLNSLNLERKITLSLITTFRNDRFYFILKLHACKALSISVQGFSAQTIVRYLSQKAKRGFCHENSFSDTQRTFCDVQHVRDPSQKLNIVSVMKIVFFWRTFCDVKHVLSCSVGSHMKTISRHFLCFSFYIDSKHWVNLC